VLEGLREVYFGEALHRKQDNHFPITAVDRRAAVQDAKKRVSGGPDRQRVLGLALLLTASREDAVAEAGKIAREASAGPALRRDAYQMLLLGGTRAGSRRTALDLLGHPESGLRNLAVTFLAWGADGEFHFLHDTTLEHYTNDKAPPEDFVGSSHPFNPEAPKGLAPEIVRPLLNDADPKTAAAAGYLLALLEDSSGLEPLLRYWHQHADDDAWRKLVYRAVAALNDDSKVSLLEEIYGAMKGSGYYLSDFYWTIRIMDGPRALKLRKQIRHEIGMANLR
jgi:hypothetical protein